MSRPGCGGGGHGAGRLVRPGYPVRPVRSARMLHASHGAGRRHAGGLADGGGKCAPVQRGAGFGPASLAIALEIQCAGGLRVRFSPCAGGCGAGRHPERRSARHRSGVGQAHRARYVWRFDRGDAGVGGRPAAGARGLGRSGGAREGPGARRTAVARRRRPGEFRACVVGRVRAGGGCGGVCPGLAAGGRGRGLGGAAGRPGGHLFDPRRGGRSACGGERPGQGRGAEPPGRLACLVGGGGRSRAGCGRRRAGTRVRRHDARRGACVRCAHRRVAVGVRSAEGKPGGRRRRGWFSSGSRFATVPYGIGGRGAGSGVRRFGRDGPIPEHGGWLAQLVCGGLRCGFGVAGHYGGNRVCGDDGRHAERFRPARWTPGVGNGAGGPHEIRFCAQGVAIDRAGGASPCVCLRTGIRERRNGQ